MAITKLIISIEDSNDMDSTTSPHSPDKVDSGTIKGVENPIILQVGRSGRLCLWWKYGLKSEQINDDLLKPFTLEDIKCAVLQMEGLKAAEPDGFHGNFYHSCSEIVNKIISRSISEFSSLRYLYPDMNHMNIVLIPKIEAPKSISHFRPISLCNFAYKIFLKLMASRLKTHLPGLISHHQSAFVPGH
ncbi:hypothetical protein PS2_029967 [Malus domestica]